MQHSFVSIIYTQQYKDIIKLHVNGLEAMHSDIIVSLEYVHELLVNRLFKPAQEKVWLGELTAPQ